MVDQEEIESAKHFGKRLKQLRKQAALTQEELGLQLGISQRMVAYWERQSKRPPGGLLPKLGKIFNVSMDDLLGFSEPEPDRRIPNNRLWRCFKKNESLRLATGRLLGVTSDRRNHT